MIARSFARSVARQQSQFATRRYASSSTSNEAVQKAQQGAEKALEMTKKYTGVLGEKVGNLLGSYRQPIVYNSQVFLSLLKIVYRAERLAPPSLAQVQSVYMNIFQSARNLSYWRTLLGEGAWKKVAVGGLEVYGIFKIGEMVGRRNLVGYKLD